MSNIASYPPSDSDVTCTSDWADLPLQGEIWRWSPPGTDGTPSNGVGRWTRVFQSPNTLPNPDEPGKYLPPDIGFRGLNIYTEPNGTQVLIASGVSARSMLGLPAGAPFQQRLLYSYRRHHLDSYHRRCQ